MLSLQTVLYREERVIEKLGCRGPTLRSILQAVVQKVNAVGTKIELWRVELILTSFDVMKNFRLILADKGVVREAITGEEFEKGHT